MLLYNKLRKQLKLCDIIMIINSNMSFDNENTGNNLKTKIGDITLEKSESSTIQLGYKPSLVYIRTSSGESMWSNGIESFGTGAITTKARITFGSTNVTLKNVGTSEISLNYIVF